MGLTGNFGRLVVLLRARQHHREQPVPGGPGLRRLRRAGRRSQRPRPPRPYSTDRRCATSCARWASTSRSDTCFVAAQHDTATDRVAVLDTPPDPGHAPRARCTRLPGRSGAAPVPRWRPNACRPAGCAAQHARPGRHGMSAGRSTDWAQVYPEWGLAGNAAFIVGPREMSTRPRPAAADIPALLRRRRGPGRHARWRRS